MPDIPQPYAQNPIVDGEGRMTPAFSRWVTQITRLDLIVGTGSPEGVVSGTVGMEYMDDAGAVGAIKYIKRDADIAGDDSQGWVLV